MTILHTILTNTWQVMILSFRFLTLVLRVSLAFSLSFFFYFCCNSVRTVPVEDDVEDVVEFVSVCWDVADDVEEELDDSDDVEVIDEVLLEKYVFGFGICWLFLGTS